MDILLCGNFDADERQSWQQALAQALPEGRWLDLDEARAQPAAVQAAVVANPPPGSLQGLPALRLIQSLWAGVDRLLAALLPPDGLGQAAAPWRAAVLLMVVVQGVTGAMLVLHLLARRLEEPLARLTEQAHALAALRPATTLPLRDQAPELQPLARGLDALRERTAQVQGELQAGKAKLRRAATHDALTGLPNRTLLQELFGHEAASARRQARSLALLRIGIDRLHTVNETLGHSVGEELLTGMAHRLAATLRDSDFICRGVAGTAAQPHAPGLRSPSRRSGTWQCPGWPRRALATASSRACATPTGPRSPGRACAASC